MKIGSLNQASFIHQSLLFAYVLLQSSHVSVVAKTETPVTSEASVTAPDLSVEQREAALLRAIRNGDRENYRTILKNAEAAQAARFLSHAALEAIIFRDPQSLNDVLDIAAQRKMSPSLLKIADEKGRTLLGSAAELGEVEIANVLLQRGADINAPSSGLVDGNYVSPQPKSPLERAYLAEQVGVLQLLISKNADLKAPFRSGFSSSGGQTLLRSAAAWGNRVLETLLLQHGVDAKTPGALELAAVGGDVETAKRLLDAGAVINPPIVDPLNDKIWSPLQRVTWQSGSKDMVSMLLARGADVGFVGDQDRTSLTDALQSGDADVIKILLQANASVNPRLQWSVGSPLKTALLYGDRDIAQQLLLKGALFSYSDNDGKVQSARPLFDAAIKGDALSVATALKLASSGDRERDGLTPLHVAAFFGRTAVITTLLQSGANGNVADERGRTPLHMAAYGGDVATAKLLIEHGAGVNATDRTGQTPLFVAAFDGSKELIELLTKSGAKVNMQLAGGMFPALFAKGVTPLHRACLYGNIAAVQALIANGAEVDATDEYGFTPLQAAARGGHADVANLLLLKGAKVNAQGTFGRTALFEAVTPDQRGERFWSHPVPRRKNAGNRAEVVALLLRRGADFQTRDKRNCTPLECALQSPPSTDMQNDLSSLVQDRAFWRRQWPMQRQIVAALLNAGADARTRLTVDAFRDYDLQIFGGSGGKNLILGPTVLHLAVHGGDAQMVQLLLLHGARVQDEDSVGRSVYDWAIRRGEASIRRFDLPFISDSVRINTSGEDNSAPILTDEGEREALVSVLRSAMPENTKSSTRSVNSAAKKPVETTPARSAKRLTPLGVGPFSYVVQRGGLKLLKTFAEQQPELLHRSASQTFNGQDMPRTWISIDSNNRQTILKMAVLAQQIDIVRFLLSRREVAADVPGTVGIAASYKNESLVDFLLKNGGSIDEKGYNGDTALHYAAQRSDVEETALLLSRGANPNIWNNQAETPWNIASQSGINGAKIAALLKEHGAKEVPSFTQLIFESDEGALKLLESVDQTTALAYAKQKFTNENTFLHQAVMWGRASTAQKLLTLGSDPNARGDNDVTPLIVSLNGKDKSVIELLLAHGADPNLDPDAGRPQRIGTTDKGQKVRILARPPLFAAVAQGNIDYVTLLLNRGARLDIKDQENTSLLQWAMQKNQPAMEKFLRSLSAKD